MSVLGRDALELQLERFFTVWCWSWDFGREENLLDYVGKPSTLGKMYYTNFDSLGLPIHPQAESLRPILDELNEKLPPGFSPVFLTSCYLLSQKPTPSAYEISLLRHLMNIAKTKIPVDSSTNMRESNKSERELTVQTAVSLTPSGTAAENDPTSKKFIGMPVFNLNKDVGKWLWQNYLPKGTTFPSFSLKSRLDGDVTEDKRPDTGSDEKGDVPKHKGSRADTTTQSEPTGLEPNLGSSPIDDLALLDALSTECALPSGKISPTSPSSPDFLVANHIPPSEVKDRIQDSQAPKVSTATNPKVETAEFCEDRTEAEPFDKLSNAAAEAVSFSEFLAYLDDSSNPLTRHFSKVKYQTVSGFQIV